MSALTCNMVGHSAFGDASVLSVMPLTLSAPAAGQIRMTVKAVSINPIDYKRREGKLKLIEGPQVMPLGICHDAAGVVESVGEGVTEFKVGDRVATRKRGVGTYAEATLTGADVSAKIPDSVSFAHAAALPLAGMTALQALRAADLKAGETVFISGGAGGVGHYAVQLAKHYFKAGKVVATCSGSKAALCKSLGADEVVDYTAVPHGTQYAGRGKFDVVMDTVGDSAAMCVLGKPHRNVVSVVNLDLPMAPNATFVVRAFLMAMGAPVHFAAWRAGTTYQFVRLTPNAADLAFLLGLLDNKTIVSTLDTTFHGLAACQDAFNKAEHGRPAGKVVIEI